MGVLGEGAGYENVGDLYLGFGIWNFEFRISDSVDAIQQSEIRNPKFGSTFNPTTVLVF